MDAPTAVRDPKRVVDAELHQRLFPEQAVEWMPCTNDPATQQLRPCSWCAVYLRIANFPHAHTEDAPVYLEPGGRYEIVPEYSDPEDWNGMRVVIARMREQPVEVQQRFLWRLNDVCSGSLGSLKPDWVVLHLTPEAVCAAALAALAAREARQ